MPGEGREVIRNVEVNPTGQTYPGLIIFRIDQLMFFAKAPKFRKHVNESIEEAETPVRVVLIDADDIPDIDSTALDMLIDLNKELDNKGVELWFARVKLSVERMIFRSSLGKQIGSDRIFRSIRSGVDAFLAQKVDMDPNPRKRILFLLLKHLHLESDLQWAFTTNNRQLGQSHHTRSKKPH